MEQVATNNINLKKIIKSMRMLACSIEYPRKIIYGGKEHELPPPEKDETVEILQSYFDNRQIRLIVIPREKDEIQIDWDMAKSAKTQDGQIEMLKHFCRFNNASMFYWASKSGNNLHFIIKMPTEISDYEQMIYALLLGSDADRERNSLVKNGYATRWVLFKPAEAPRFHYDPKKINQSKVVAKEPELQVLPNECPHTNEPKTKLK